MKLHVLGQFISFGIFCLAIAELVIGLVHLNDCPFDPEIPVWLIICAVATLLRVPVFVVSYCNIIVSEVSLIAMEIMVFLVGAFDLGWLVHGAYLVLKRVPDVADSNSTSYCESKLYEISQGAMFTNGIFLPLLSCNAAISLYADRSYESI